MPHSSLNQWRRAAGCAVGCADRAREVYFRRGGGGRRKSCSSVRRDAGNGTAECVWTPQSLVEPDVHGQPRDRRDTCSRRISGDYMVIGETGAGCQVHAASLGTFRLRPTGATCGPGELHRTACSSVATSANSPSPSCQGAGICRSSRANRTPHGCARRATALDLVFERRRREGVEPGRWLQR
jgi:hypothetical protein